MSAALSFCDQFCSFSRQLWLFWVPCIWIWNYFINFWEKARFCFFLSFLSSFQISSVPTFGYKVLRSQSPGGLERACTAVLLSLKVGLWQPDVPSSGTVSEHPYSCSSSSSCSLVTYFVILFVFLFLFVVVVVVDDRILFHSSVWPRAYCVSQGTNDKESFVPLVTMFILLLLHFSSQDDVV